MRLITALLVLGATLLAYGCSKSEDKTEAALERAQEKLQASVEKIEDRLAEGTAKAKDAFGAAMGRWEDLRPEAERVIAAVEARVEALSKNPEALNRVGHDAFERAKAHLESMREKLAEAKSAHEKGQADIAVEKADEVQKESAAMEELLVEKPDSPSH
jgi:hypothetical protein